MAIALRDLVRHCDETLHSRGFADYCPNGLQVEGRGEVARIAAAVSANQSVLEAAVAWGADALLVHHGYFWKGEAAEIVGMKRRRLGTLLACDMSLLAYHLPLDAHPVLGNNAQWGERLQIQDIGPLDPLNPTAVGNLGRLAEARTLSQLCSQIHRLTGREPLLIGDPAQTVSRVAWCTGAAQGYIDKAVTAGAEVYISGEISEPTVHTARESNIAYIAAGHHATERYGVQALASALADRFALEWTFIDSDNPV